jgi:hypothetical protein
MPELFQAEIIYRFFDPGSFLPLAILVIVLGWRYRTRNLPFLLGIPMLAVAPIICNGVITLYQTSLHTFSVWSVITFGFPLSIVIFSLGLMIFSILSLILLIGQRE